MIQTFIGLALPFGPEAVARAADELGVDAACVLAVTEVETAGCGFLADRRPQILFERHIFHRLTGGRFDREAPSVSSPQPGGYGPSGEAQYVRLARAMRFDADAALQSTSWGLGQILGCNAAMVGYADAAAMVAAFRDGEAAHLLALARYCRARGLARAMQREDWATFARGYNGPNYRQNAYDRKLREAVARMRCEASIDLRMRRAQVYLRYLGFYRERIDGVHGAATAAAVRAIQQRHDLPATGDLDPATEAAIAKCFRVMLVGGKPDASPRMAAALTET